MLDWANSWILHGVVATVNGVLFMVIACIENHLSYCRLTFYLETLLNSSDISSNSLLILLDFFFVEDLQLSFYWEGCLSVNGANYSVWLSVLVFLTFPPSFFLIVLTRIFNGEGNGNPLQYSCLENPRDCGALWAAVYGIAQSQTRLKWLSSSHSRIFKRVAVIDRSTLSCLWFLSNAFRFSIIHDILCRLLIYNLYQVVDVYFCSQFTKG